MIGLQIPNNEMLARADIHVFDAFPDFDHPKSFRKLMHVWVGTDGSVYVKQRFVPGQTLAAISIAELDSIPETKNVDLSKKIPFFFDFSDWPKHLPQKPFEKISFHPDGKCDIAGHRAYRPPFSSATNFSLLCIVYFAQIDELPLEPFQEHQTDKIQVLPLMALNRTNGIAASLWVGPTDHPMPLTDDRYGPIENAVMDIRYDIYGIKSGRAPINSNSGKTGISLIICGGEAREPLQRSGVFLASSGPLDQYP